MRDYLDDPPSDAIEKVATATFLLALLMERAKESHAFVNLMERAASSFARTPAPWNPGAVAAAYLNLGRFASGKGDHVGGIRFVDEVIHLLGNPANEQARAVLADPDDNQGRLTLAEALGLQADIYYRRDKAEAGDARCDD